MLRSIENDSGVARFARIYPLYFLTLVVGAITSFIERAPKLGFAREAVGIGALFVEQTLLLQHWLPKLSVINFPSWSISTEAFFYLVFPWIGIWLWRSSMLKATLLAFAVCGLAELLDSIDAVGTNSSFSPVIELRYLVAGIVLAKAHLALMRWKGGNEWLVRNGALIFTVTFFSLLFLFEYHSALHFDKHRGSYCIVLYSLLILSCASGNPFVSQLFSLRWLVILGESSYGLYLLHAPMYGYSVARLGSHSTHLAFVLYLIGTIVLSVVSFYYFETPARRAILRYFSTRSRESTAEAAIAQ